MGQIHQFVELWEPKRLPFSVESEDGNNRQEAVLEAERRATVVAHNARMQLSYITVESDWFAEYIGQEIGKIYEYYIA